MDRRRLSHTPEATAFNNQLLEAVAEFVASTVAVDLVQRCNLSVESVCALIPEDAGHLDGAAGAIADLWHSALSAVPFLPLADGQQLGRATDVKLLPDTLPDLPWAHRLAALPESQTLRADVEAALDVREYVSTVNETAEMTDAEFLSMLTLPAPDTTVDHYSFLVAWRKAHYSLVDDLKSIPCVLTTNGQFLAPAEHSIFFPRRDESVPDDIPVPIASIPAVAGVESLLSDLGVRNFEWRDLIRDYLIKILEREEADLEERARAMAGLRAYQAARSKTGEVATPILGRVLVPARNWDGTTTGLRPAGRVYFGSDWTGTTDLEAIYGPFNEVEFLAVGVSEEADPRHDDEDFYRMLGVTDRPRLDQVSTSHAVDRHPHRQSSPALYHAWLNQVGGRCCPLGHDQSQRLVQSYRMDRLEMLVTTKDPQRLLRLWRQLARNWAKFYEDGTQSTIRCEHGWHKTENERTVESLFAYTLRSHAWVPVELGGQPDVVRPEEAWVETTEPPSRIRSRIPRISPTMSRMRGGLALIDDLGLIDSSHPEVSDLLDLLESVAAEAEAAGATNRDIELAARWIQHTVEDVLGPEIDPHPAPGDVRVLALHRGETTFASQPPYAEDPLLRDTWQHQLPVLLADTGIAKLARYLDLTRLDDEIETTAVPLRPRYDEALHRVRHRVDDAKPYIVALVRSENSRLVNRAIRALRHLEIIVCDRLLLRYQYNGMDIERDDACCYIAVRDEVNEGRRTQPIGTAYIELDRITGEPEWFSVGTQLAQHLNAAAYTDAITMLLKVDAEDRNRMMANRHIPASAIVEARAGLDLPLEDEPHSRNVLDTYLSTHQDMPTAPADNAYEKADSTADSEVQHPSEPGFLDPTDAAPRLFANSTEPPAIDFASITVTDAKPAAIADTRRGALDRSPSFNAGAISSAPSIQSETERRRVGKRGEEVVFFKERERVEELGLAPDLVIWQSKNDELAPIDILSIDDDGQRTYIEVKSTVASDPRNAFYISDAELLEASFHRSRYYIYRVTDVDTATPQVTRWQNPLELIKNGQGRLLLDTAQMELGLEASEPDA
jgi:hypothetical protein